MDIEALKDKLKEDIKKYSLDNNRNLYHYETIRNLGKKDYAEEILEFLEGVKQWI